MTYTRRQSLAREDRDRMQITARRPVVSVRKPSDARGDRLLSIFLVSMFLRTFIVVSANVFRLPNVTWITNTALIPFFIVCMLYVATRRGTITFVRLLFLACFYLANILLFPQNKDFIISTISDTVFSVLPFFVVSLCQRNTTYLMQILKRISSVCITISTLLFALYYDRIAGANYSMSFGYMILPFICVCILQAIQTRKVINVVLVVLGTCLLIALGSRGPILCIAVFILVLIFWYARSHRHGAVICVGTVVIFGILYTQLDGLLVLLGDLFTVFGIRSRTITLLSRDILYSSGRDNINSLLLAETMKAPFTIRGINAEYVLRGNYAHNIVVELLYQFGIVIGGAMLCAILYLAKRTIFVLGTIRNIDIICLLFLSISLPKLMVSGTLWRDPGFWVWIGLTMTKITTDRKSPTVHP